MQMCVFGFFLTKTNKKPDKT